MSRIVGSLREQVRQRANRRCEYCGIPEGYSRFKHQVDHVLPPRHTGSDEFPNLAWACHRCNHMKGTDISTVDSETRQKVWLFNPREQLWDDHFAINTDGYIVGITAEGRGTARLLGMNDEDFPRLRRVIMKIGRW